MRGRRETSAGIERLPWLTDIDRQRGDMLHANGPLAERGAGAGVRTSRAHSCASGAAAQHVAATCTAPPRALHGLRAAACDALVDALKEATEADAVELGGL